METAYAAPRPNWIIAIIWWWWSWAFSTFRVPILPYPLGYLPITQPAWWGSLMSSRIDPLPCCRSLLPPNFWFLAPVALCLPLSRAGYNETGHPEECAHGWWQTSSRNHTHRREDDEVYGKQPVVLPQGEETMCRHKTSVCLFQRQRELSCCCFPLFWIGRGRGNRFREEGTESNGCCHESISLSPGEWFTLSVDSWRCKVRSLITAGGRLLLSDCRRVTFPHFTPVFLFLPEKITRYLSLFYMFYLFSPFLSSLLGFSCFAQPHSHLLLCSLAGKWILWDGSALLNFWTRLRPCFLSFKSIYRYFHVMVILLAGYFCPASAEMGITGVGVRLPH